MPADSPTAAPEHRELALLHSYRSRGDQAARDELIRRFTPLVRATAYRYRGRGEDIEDLVQVGMVGLVKAIERFEPGRAGRFVSYAGPTISGEIKRHFRDHLWAVHVPRGMQELQARVTAEESRIERAGLTATNALIAERLDVAVEEIDRARIASRAFRADSLDVPADGAGGGWDGSFHDPSCTDLEYDRVDDAALIGDAMAVLDERERAIVSLRYEQGLLQREIAAELAISQMQVSRLLRRALERMRARLGGGTVNALPA